MLRKALLVVVLIVLLGGSIAFVYYNFNQSDANEAASSQKNERMEVTSVAELENEYDVIVVGTDPEGITAAVSAARNGLSTLLIDGNHREVLGGLMTVGWLNSIDMNWDRTKAPQAGHQPEYFNKGIFEEWYSKIEGHSFDVTTAANVFYELVKAEENIDLFMGDFSIEPLIEVREENTTVQGIRIIKQDGEQDVFSNAVIDATQDADVAAAAGVSFTLGREDLGDKNSQMAVTAVFRMKNVDDHVWNLIAKRLNKDGDINTGVDQLSAWGYGKEMHDYIPLNKERTKMRGLNIGRQLDDTMLINALHIFGVDPLDPESKQEGLQIAHEEVQNVLKFLKKFKEFKHVELDAVASELYVRETRHMVGLYRLNIIDLLENRDQWDRIAFGSYPVDIQRTSPEDQGAVVLNPLKYAVPFRSIVPESVDGLLVVGRSASFDTLAHGSARVIPTGMATGQAAGAAAKITQEEGLTFRQLAQSPALIDKMQQRLNEQGMELEPYTLNPQPYMKHKHYPGLKAAVYMGIEYGSYENEFDLDSKANPQRIVNKLYGIGKMYKDHFKGDPGEALQQVEDPANNPLSLAQGSFTLTKAIGWNVTLNEAQEELEKRGLLRAETIKLIENKDSLTNGEMYMIIKDVVEHLVGIEFK